MRRMIWGSLVTAVAVVLGSIQGIGAATQQANGERNQRRCTEVTLRGAWGIQIQGTRPSAPGGPIESVVGVVIRHYDGEGQFTQIDNVKGSISGIVPDREGFGTYQVSADCTAVVSLQPAPGIFIVERLVIVDGGREAHAIVATPLANMVTGVHKRIQAR